MRKIRKLIFGAAPFEMFILCPYHSQCQKLSVQINCITDYLVFFFKFVLPLCPRPKAVSPARKKPPPPNCGCWSLTIYKYKLQDRIQAGTTKPALRKNKLFGLQNSNLYKAGKLKFCSKKNSNVPLFKFWGPHARTAKELFEKNICTLRRL